MGVTEGRDRLRVTGLVQGIGLNVLLILMEGVGFRMTRCRVKIDFNKVKLST